VVPVFTQTWFIPQYTPPQYTGISLALAQLLPQVPQA
jgi:hypothetical protein